MDAEEKVEKAKLQLVFSNIFFARILMSVDIREDNNNTLTMATDGKRLIYNSKFLEKLTIPELVGIMVHETEHILFMHPLKVFGKDHQLWNMACDYAINPLILSSGFTLPKDRLGDYRFQDKSSEEIYLMLLQDEQDNPGSTGKNIFVDIGGIMKPTSANGQVMSEGELEKLEGEIKIIISQAVEMAKKQPAGNIPAGLEKYIKQVLNPKVSCEELIRNLVTSKVRNDYTWTKTNKRYQNGCLQPSLEEQSLGTIVMAIDTSGSLSEDEHNKILTKITSFLGQYKCTLYIMWCDCRLNHVEIYDFGDDIPNKMYGGGGTCYRPVFDYIEKEDIDPTCVMYFTDGYCNSFPDESQINYPVLWILTQDNRDNYFKTNIGETIQLQLD